MENAKSKDLVREIRNKPLPLAPGFLPGRWAVNNRAAVRFSTVRPCGSYRVRVIAHTPTPPVRGARMSHST